jgi:tetrahydromethanopterin S-methyltransferase subunit B
MFGPVFDRFVKQSPVTVMFRSVLERALSAEQLDRLFERTAERQYCRELLFSTCVDLLALVVAGTRKSVNDAYRALTDEVTVSVRAVYDKLAKLEPRVSEALVRDTAFRLRQVLTTQQTLSAEPLCGYRVRILDGNHLAATEHRLKALRRRGAAPLPGWALAVLDQQSQLVEQVLTCADAHANERTLLPRVLELAEAEDCWVADRNFCTYPFLFGLTARHAAFVIRQHGQVQGQLQGPRQQAGRTATGLLFEQSLVVTLERETLGLRRVTLELDQPTRDGENEIHVLTNLPASIGAPQIAELYLQRWQIETAFMHLATALRSEINTLGYPDAALFGFCLGLVLYNVLAVLQATLRAAHPDALPGQRLSFYYLGGEIASVYRGLMIAVPPAEWQFLSQLSATEFGQTLRQLADQVRIRTFLANPTRKNKPPPIPRPRASSGSHVAT